MLLARRFPFCFRILDILSNSNSRHASESACWLQLEQETMKDSRIYRKIML
jgi:hypothetical protein